MPIKKIKRNNKVVIAIGDEGRKNYHLSMTDEEIINDYNGKNVQVKKEVVSEYKAYHRGGGKWDVSIEKGGEPVEGGDNLAKDDALALAEKLNK